MFSFLMRFLTGHVVFEAYGGFSERFINLCNVRGILISNVHFSENKLEATVGKKDYIRLRQIAKACAMKVRFVSKHGLPFFIFKHRNRVGLVAGSVFFVVFMCVMSMFIWSVETVGSEKISSSEILKTVSELGVYKGAFKPKIKSREISRRTVENMNGKLLWAAVNIKGSRAVVEVRDYVEHRDDMTYKEPCNIVADFDGLILSIEVESGTKANCEGNGVKKGDLLISGMLEDRYERTHFYEARGTVTVLHNDCVKLCKDPNECIKKFYKTEKVKYLNLFFLKIPLGLFSKDSDYEEFEKQRNLVLNNVPMPIGITEKTRAYRKNTTERNDSVYIFAFDDFLTEYREKYKNTYIVSSKLKTSGFDGKVNITSSEKCIDFMGTKQIISFAD